MASYTEDWIVGPANTNFYSRRYAPTANTKVKAHVVCVHGFQEHIARYDHVFQRVQRAGVEVFAFDQRGWGRTALDDQHKSAGSRYGLTNRHRQLEDLEFFVKRESEKAKEAGVPLFLWGHSMDLSRDSAVVAAARVDPMMKPFASLGCLDGILSAGDFLHTKGYNDFPKELPLLMWQGTQDKICSYPAGKAFYEQAPATDKTWIDFPDSYHEILNEPHGVWEKATDDAVAWFVKHADASAASGSGAGESPAAKL